MARPPLLIKRDQRLVIKLTPAEYALLQTRAEAVGLRLVYSEWHRVGSNLNQVARQLNAFGSVQAPEVEAVLRDIRSLIAREPK